MDGDDDENPVAGEDMDLPNRESARGRHPVGQRLEISTLVTSSASMPVISAKVMPTLNSGRGSGRVRGTLPYQRRLNKLCTMSSTNMAVPASSCTVLPSHQ